MKDKKITYANEDGLFRLSAVEMVQNGESFKSVAQKVGVHQSTIAEWCKMYEEGGVERLNTYRKPRPKHEMSKEKILSDLGVPDILPSYKRRLLALLDIANGGALMAVAKNYDISPQLLAKWRRQYLTPEAEKFIEPWKARQILKRLEETRLLILSDSFKRPTDKTKALRFVARTEAKIEYYEAAAKQGHSTKVANQKHTKTHSIR